MSAASTDQQTDSQKDQTDSTSQDSDDSTNTDSTNTDSSDDDGGGDDKSITDSINFDSQDSSGKGSDDATAKKTDDDASDGDKPPKGAPSEYTAFESRDGFDPTEEQATQLSEQAKGLNLSQEDAQSLHDFLGDHVVDHVLPAIKAKQDAAYSDYLAEELTKAKMDPALVGPNGDKWDDNQKFVEQVVSKFAGKGTIGEGHFAAAKKDGVMGTHWFLSLMTGIGKAMMPDTLDPAGDPGSEGDDSNKPDYEQMGWDDNAEPIGLRRKNAE